MRIQVAVLAMAFAFSTGAFAQVDDEAMETQRCIWRCQAEHGSNWARYEQCTVDLCSGKPKRKQSTAKAPRKARTKSTKRRVIRNWRGDVLIRRVN